MASQRFASLIRKVNFYPPFLGMGIRVRSRNADFTRFEVELRERWFTRNLFGTHFGGSLYTMADPFFVFIVTINFGRGYVVWDQSASIDFLKPATGTITGVFEIETAQLEAMRKDVDTHGKRTFEFTAPLIDENGVTVATVRKLIYARVKTAKPSAARTD